MLVIVYVCHCYDMLAQCGRKWLIIIITYLSHYMMLLPFVAFSYAYHSLCLSLLWHVGPVWPLVIIIQYLYYYMLLLPLGAIIYACHSLLCFNTYSFLIGDILHLGLIRGSTKCTYSFMFSGFRTRLPGCRHVWLIYDMGLMFNCYKVTAYPPARLLM